MTLSDIDAIAPLIRGISVLPVCLAVGVSGRKLAWAANKADLMASIMSLGTSPSQLQFGLFQDTLALIMSGHTSLLR